MKQTVGRLSSSHADRRASTGLMLWRVTNSWQRSIRDALSGFDLTHVQFVLLAVLAATDPDAKVTQSEVAEAASTDPMMTSQVLRVLERKGLIERLAHPLDGRAKSLVPTRKGLELVNRANAAVEAADREYFSPLAQRLAEFTETLATLDERTKRK